MKKYYLLLLFAVLPFICNAQGTFNATITHDGLERSYIIYVPASYDPTIPSALVLCFHGYSSSANTIWFYSGFNKIADTANFLVAYPQGTLLEGVTHWNVGGWTNNSTTDDIGFTNALLDSISADYSIDSTRVFATGMSNGGFMSFLLACQLSERIAAVASVTGSMTTETYNACDPQHPTPVLQIHGTSDGTVPYLGASWTKSISEVMDYWVDFNNTNTVATRASIEDINKGDGSTAEKIRYAAGDSCSSVTHYKITDGDHDWPGAWGNLDINASALIWDFFSQHDINGKIACAEEGSDQVLSNTTEEVLNTLNIYPNPSSNFITIEGEQLSSRKYEVRSVDGKVVLKGFLKATDNRIDITTLEQGMYIVKMGKQSVKIIKED
jgi:polyhydroxybutyrate depolymerase